MQGTSLFTRYVSHKTDINRVPSYKKTRKRRRRSDFNGECRQETKDIRRRMTYWRDEVMELYKQQIM